MGAVDSDLETAWLGRTAPDHRLLKPMRPSVALLNHRSSVHTLARRHRLGNPRVFGSALRGTDTESSDLDLLVDAPPGATLLDLGNLQADLEDLLGVRVDVVTPQELPARWREQVLAEARPV